MIFKQILNEEVNFNDSDFGDSGASGAFDTYNINDLISKLLKKDPQERLCNIEAIKNHPFFQSFNWNRFYSFEMHGPFIPRYPSFKSALENPQKFSDILEQRSKKYFYEDNLGNEVIIKDNPTDKNVENYEEELINWENSF